MLAESKFDFEQPLTGLEIELNLVDEHHDPVMRNAEVIDAIADESFQTELGQFNIEINVRHGASPARRPRRLRQSCGRTSTPPRSTHDRLARTS
jgi:gamma-glutamyl:cysteine ligase YbdK (ATP-grasp superfamily)